MAVGRIEFDFTHRFSTYTKREGGTLTYNVGYRDWITKEIHWNIGTIFPVYRYADGTDARTRQAWEVTGSTARFSTLKAAANFLALRHRTDAAFAVAPTHTPATVTPVLAIPAECPVDFDNYHVPAKERRATCGECGMFRAVGPGFVGWRTDEYGRMVRDYRCRVCNTRHIARFYSDAPRAERGPMWGIALPAHMAWANLEAEQDYLNRQQDHTLGELEYETKQLRDMHRGFLPYARISTQMRAVARAATEAALVAEALEAVATAKATLYWNNPVVARMVDGETPSPDREWTPPELPAMSESDWQIAATDEAMRSYAAEWVN